MTTRFMRFCFLSLSVFLASPRSARGTVLVPADLAELSRDARAIVRGRVVALDPRWSDDRRSIETIVTLDVEGYLKGTFGQTVQFRVSGGTLGRFRFCRDGRTVGQEADDDHGGFFTSEISFTAGAGNVYHIAIDGLAGESGNIVLSWDLQITAETVPQIVRQPADLVHS